MTQVVDIAVGSEAADDVGARGGGQRMALGADGNFAVIADADAGALAPDERPPGTGRSGTKNGALFSAGLSLGSVGCGAQFAMDFVVVGVG